MPAEWGRVTAQEVVAAVRGIITCGEGRIVFEGVSTDSRTIRPGEAFWALKGERYDGHDFVGAAVEKGASGIVVEKGYAGTPERIGNAVWIEVQDTLDALGDLAGWWRRSHDMRVAAVTGSAGKTTTKEMIACILDFAHSVLKTQGNFNNLIGLPLTLLRAENRHDTAVLEMGMNRSGEIARLTEIALPDVGVITNVGKAHLEGLRDLEGVARAKVELVEKMPSISRIVLNGDDEVLMKAARAFRKDPFTFGMGAGRDLMAQNIRSRSFEGISFDLRYDKKIWPVKLRVLGLQNVLNALAAAAVALCLEETPERILEGLGRFEGVKGRFTVVPLPEDAILIDDTYNANPSSLKSALDALKPLVRERSRLLVGLGEMLELGRETVHAHEEAGRWVAELGPRYLLALGPHAREMVHGARLAGLPPEHAQVVDGHAEMVKRIREELEPGDLIFLKGSRRMGLERVVERLKGPLE